MEFDVIHPSRQAPCQGRVSAISLDTIEIDEYTNLTGNGMSILNLIFLGGFTVSGPYYIRGDESPEKLGVNEDEEINFFDRNGL